MMVGSQAHDLKAIARSKRQHARRLEQAQVAVARAEMQLHEAVARLGEALLTAPSAQIGGTIALRSEVESIEAAAGRLRVQLWERIEEIG